MGKNNASQEARRLAAAIEAALTIDQITYRIKESVATTGGSGQGHIRKTASPSGCGAIVLPGEPAVTDGRDGRDGGN